MEVYHIRPFIMSVLQLKANFTKRPMDELIEEWQQAQRARTAEEAMMKTEEEELAELEAMNEQWDWKEEDVGVDT